MLEFLGQVRDTLVNGWRNSRGVDRLPYVLVFGLLVAFIAGYMIWALRPTWTFLLRVPNPSYGSRVTEFLEKENIAYKLDGDSVYVEGEAARDKAKFAIAGQGMINGGGQFGWEVFLEPKLGTTSNVLRIQVQQAKRTDIERTIATSPFVSWAIVQMDIPEDKLFPDPSQRPTASVTLQATGRLSPEQVRAVQNIVASGQVGLDAGSVRVMDSDLNLLSEAQALDPLMGVTASQLDLKRAMEQSLEANVVAMLVPVVGDGNTRVKVNLDLDFLNRTTVKNEVDPATEVIVREEVTSEENSSGSRGGAPGLDSNVPGEGIPAASYSPSSSKSEMMTTEREFTRSTVTDTEVGPQVKRMSVAVLVDGIYEEGPDGGVPLFKAREQSELDGLREIVESAVGYDSKRDGSSAVTIACYPFQRVETPPVSMAGQIGDFVLSPQRIVTPVLLLVIPLLSFFLFRSFDKRREKVRQEFHQRMEKLIEPLRKEAASEESGLSDLGEVDLQSVPEEEKRTFMMQDKLGEWARRNPEEFAHVIKSWINE